MRQGNQNKRMRSRNRKGPSPLSRSYESNGPDVKIRGTALHIAEKYAQLSRDAHSSGDRIMAENYLQHAEHYYRIVASAQPQGLRDEQGRDVRGDDPRGDERGYANDRQGDFDDDRDDEGPRINGHAARGNGAAPNGVRHLAEAEQPDLVPPEHFERGGVDNVPVEKAVGPVAGIAQTDPEGKQGDGAGETSPTARSRRHRTPRPPRSPRSSGSAAVDGDAPEGGSASAAATEADTSAGDA